MNTRTFISEDSGEEVVAQLSHGGGIHIQVVGRESFAETTIPIHEAVDFARWILDAVYDRVKPTR